MEIWEPKTPGTLWATPGLLRDCFAFLTVEVKFTLEQAMKTQRGSRCVALLFAQSQHYMGVGGQHHATAAFTPGKDPVPIVQEAGLVPGPVWMDPENLVPTGIRSPDRPACSGSLYRLSYPGPYEHMYNS
jgi:hypothetical protein